MFDAIFGTGLTRDIDNENKMLDEIYEGIDNKTLIVVSHRNNTVKSILRFDLEKIASSVLKDYRNIIQL